MARTKSISGSRAESSTDKVTATTTAVVPDGKTVAETAPSKVNAEPRKFDPKKTEPRASVVPINVEDEIRRRAYELYEQRGRSSGHEKEDWAVAEREVRQRYHQQSA